MKGVSVGLQELREVVSRLKEKPFSEDYTLVTLEEMNTVEMGELLVRVFKQLDSDFQLSIRESAPELIVHKFSFMLKALQYPCAFDQDWSTKLLNGDRKVINPILFYVLRDFEEHRKAAYVAKFITMIDVPGEYLGDPEIKKLHEQFKEKQAEFEVIYEQNEELSKENMNPAELIKVNKQLEAEREQLVAKVNVIRSKHSAKPMFQLLLAETSNLRKEQEEESNLENKLYNQKLQLEAAESTLLSAQQALNDSRKSISPNNTPEQMLAATKAEVKKNRDYLNNRLSIELSERQKKLGQIEKLLAEPPITQNELMTLEANLNNMRRAVTILEEKVAKDSAKDDKLAIYKQQAAMVLKNKEKKMEELKRNEEELETLEKEIRKKEEVLGKNNRGGKRDDYLKYADEIKEKRTIYNRNMEEYEDLKGELQTLRRTCNLLEADKERYAKFLSPDGKGIEGGRMQSSNSADKSLDELNRMAEKLTSEIAEKKTVVQPLLDRRKQLRGEYERVEAEYQAKKGSYEKTVSKSEEEFNRAKANYKKIRDEVYANETKIALSKFKSEILDLKFERLEEEAKSAARAPGFKTYADWMQKLIKDDEAEIKTLTAAWHEVNENYKPSQEQAVMFSDLAKLLKLKLAMGASQKSAGTKKGQNVGANVQVLSLS